MVLRELGSSIPRIIHLPTLTQRASFDVARFVEKHRLPPPRMGQNTTAQGNALGGLDVSIRVALKGRNNQCADRCFTLSGLRHRGVRGPRALPWAVMLLPLRGEARKRNIKKRKRGNGLFLACASGLCIDPTLTNRDWG